MTDTTSPTTASAAPRARRASPILRQARTTRATGEMHRPATAPKWLAATGIQARRALRSGHVWHPRVVGIAL